MTSTLYYFPNSTATAAAADAAPHNDAALVAAAVAAAEASTFVASQLETLVSINGTAEAPVRNVAIVGLALAHTAPTFLSDYEVASAGDWVRAICTPLRFSKL